MKNKELIKKLESMKEPLGREEYLQSLFSELSAYMTLYPVKTPGAIHQKSSYFEGRSLFRFVAITLSIVFLFASTGVAYASQRSLPGDTFYPVKITTEHIQEIFVRDTIKKAQLETIFAKRRVEEIKEINKKRGGDEWRIKIAEDRLEEHVGNVRNILEDQSKKELSIEMEKEISFNLHEIERETETVKKQEENIKEVQGREKLEVVTHGENTDELQKEDPLPQPVIPAEEIKKEDKKIEESSAEKKMKEMGSNGIEKQEGVDVQDIKNELGDDKAGEQVAH